MVFSDVYFDVARILSKWMRHEVVFETNTQILRNFNVKIGMNTTENKLYHLNNVVGLNMLNNTFVHFKKLAKIQFLKYGNIEYNFWFL